MMKRKGILAFGVALLLLSNPAAWAAQDVALIKGLDGGDYEPYKAAVVERVQGQLAELGLYDGAVDGKLSQETMEALGQFQKENDLVVTGIPTPRTRQKLRKAVEAYEGAAPQKEK